MMDDFEELEKIDVWHEARALAVLIYKHTDRSGWTLDFILRDETRSTAIAISTDIARGYGLGTSADVQRQVRKARGSCYRLVTMIRIGHDLGYVPREELDELSRAIRTVVRMIDDLLRQNAGRRRER